ncbi:MAG: hypothetical protein Kow0089_14650 [Desulfobulbaceae bacterium]
MIRKTIHRVFTAALLTGLICLAPLSGFGEEVLGGITFLGEREGVCVLIEGEYLEESIYFKLDTCDANREVKEQFRDRTPFTLLVPKGSHRLVIMKEGEKVVTDTIAITPGEVTEYRLP